MAEEIATRDYDVVVIGAGGAGLRAAVEAAGDGLRVCVVCKSLLGKAHTVMAEGGVAAAFGNVDPKDTWRTHFYDTMKGGQFLNDYRTVQIYAQEAPERVLELEAWGALFDRTPEGRILQRAFGAHTFRRLCHVGDHTGLELIRTMQYRAIRSPIDVLQEFTTTRLLTEAGAVAGLVGYFRQDGQFLALRARAVVLATGGWGKAYKVTSNSWESTGDGAAMAYRAGAVLKDMEMVQFHPTGMVWPSGVRGILVTEGVRGEGGLLYNSEGERFMLRYDPQKKELSSRDVVARSIYKEVQAGRGTPHGGAWLDISHRGREFVLKKLPSMYEQFLTLADVDITKDRFEVAPTVHYTMGGVRAEPETGATNIPGLFAAGEVACGLHGANRLGGNSLGDLLVFGRRAGAAAREYAQGRTGSPRLDPAEVQAEVARVLAPLGRSAGESPYLLHQELQEVMSAHAGISRNGPDLAAGLEKVQAIRERAERAAAPGGRAYNPGWHAVLDVQNMALLSEAIVRCAILRRESRGAHWRTDFPEADPELGKVNFIAQADGDTMRIDTAPVPEMPEELAAMFRAGVAPGAEAVPAAASGGKGGN